MHRCFGDARKSMMRPIFISGINRTGTHLLFSLLSGHSGLFVTGLEDDLVTAFAENGPEFERAFVAGSIGKLYRALLAHTCLPTLKLIGLRGTRNYTHAKEVYDSTVDFPFNLRKFEDDFLERLSGPNWTGLSAAKGADVFSAFYESLALAFAEQDKPVIVSKPGKGLQGFQNALPFLQGLNAKILYTIRDPRGVACSNTKGKGDVGPVVQEWRTDLEALEAMKLGFDVLVVRYEDLCRDTGKTMNRVAKFIGVEQEDILLRPQMLGGDFSGNSSFEDFGGAISDASVDRWTTILSDKDIHRIEDAAWVEMERSGYECQNRISAVRRMKRSLLKAVRSFRGN